MELSWQASITLAHVRISLQVHEPHGQECARQVGFMLSSV